MQDESSTAVAERQAEHADLFKLFAGAIQEHLAGLGIDADEVARICDERVAQARLPRPFLHPLLPTRPQPTPMLPATSPRNKLLTPSPRDGGGGLLESPTTDDGSAAERHIRGDKNSLDHYTAPGRTSPGRPAQFARTIGMSNGTKPASAKLVIRPR